MDFIEELPIETGFADVFHERIEPELNRLEQLRQHMRKTANRHFVICASIGVAIIIAAYFGLAGHESRGWVIALAGMGSLIMGIYKMDQATGGWTASISDVVMPAVCDFLGDMRYDRRASNRFSLENMNRLSLLARYDEAYIEDRIDGNYNGVDYTLVEARLVRTDSENDSNPKTLFHGLLFRIRLPERTPTPILITRDYGKIGNTLAGLFAGDTGRGMPRVQTQHAGFESLFELHAEDAKAAREFLPDAFLDNLLAIAHAQGSASQHMRAAFDRKDFWLALGRERAFLKMPPVSQPVGNIIPEIHRVFEDMALVRRIIDDLRV